MFGLGYVGAVCNKYTTRKSTGEEPCKYTVIAASRDVELGKQFPVYATVNVVLPLPVADDNKVHHDESISIYQSVAPVQLSENVMSYVVVPLGQSTVRVGGSTCQLAI